MDRTTTILLMNLSGCAVLGSMLLKWKCVVTANNGFPSESVWTMFDLLFITRRSLPMLGGLTGIIGTYINLRWPGSLPPFPVVFQFTLSASAVLSSLLPPVVLILGASTGETANLVGVVRSAIRPCPVVHMLDGMRLGAFSYDPIRKDNVRVGPGVSWRTVVVELCKVAPIIVVDARFESSSVAQESSQIVNSQLRSKAIFVVDSINGSPMLGWVCTLSRITPSCLKLVTEDHVKAALRERKHFLRSRSSFPKSSTERIGS
jgi:hypothetical protein